MKRISKMMTLAALAMTLSAGCGEGSDRSQILGTWSYQSGSAVLTCPGYSDTWPVQGMVTFSEGVQSDLVRTEATSVCQFNFDVIGENVTLVPGQSCEFSGTDTDGLYWTETYRPNSWSMQPDASGRTMTESVTFSIQVLYAGYAETCTLTQNSTLTLIGR